MLLLLLAQAVAVECSDPKTPSGQREILWGAPSCEKPPPKVPDRAVSANEQARAKAYFDEVLYDGQAARWQFKKVVNRTLICGSVNGKNRMGGYTGWHPFYFDLKEGAGDIFEDESRLWFYRALCDGIAPAR